MNKRALRQVRLALFFGVLDAPRVRVLARPLVGVRVHVQVVLVRLRVVHVGGAAESVVIRGARPRAVAPVAPVLETVAVDVVHRLFDAPRPRGAVFREIRASVAAGEESALAEQTPERPEFPQIARRRRDELLEAPHGGDVGAGVT